MSEGSSPKPSFPTTQWSAVYRAGQPGGAADDPLGALLERYLPALRAYLVSTRRLRPEDAEDLLHDFILEKVVRQSLMARADERRGRFRTFLLTVLNRFLIDRHRATKRSPDARPVALPGPDGAVDRDPGPTDAFDVEWAKRVLAQAVEATEQELRGAGRADIWALFERRVLQPALTDAAPPGYDALVAELGLRSPAQAANLLVTAKRTYARNLREVVRDYARDETEVETEIAELGAILARSSAGPGPA